MDEKEILKTLVSKYGWNLVYSLYVEQKMSAEEMKILFDESERRKSIMDELK